MNKPLAIVGFALLVIVATLIVDGFYGMQNVIRLNGKEVEPRMEDQAWLGEYQPDRSMTLTVEVRNNTFVTQKVEKPSLKVFNMSLMPEPTKNPEWDLVREYPGESVLLEPFQTVTFTYEFKTAWKGQYRLVLEDGQTIIINFNVW